MPFHLAVTLTEQADWLIADNRGADAEPAFSEAREIFDRLGATPWLARVESAESVPREQVSI
jgi:hypothetical protein